MVIDKSITTQRPRKTVSIKGPQAQSQATMELLQQQQNQQQPIEVTPTEDGGAEINFDPQAFRGLPFAKNTLNLFVKNYLKMKVDDNLLSTIADMGYRKCRELIKQ